ncbi:exodeoxyribonuclease VII small subunit [Macrococcus armenti]|uniref:exodeoxyribonuclease VII small subunit n=1 Tax=Macrococcus armenti TaxID=2875764 RepID=UPI001CC90639|nr:exodeoxyribonuclease VII small subunit [Macrococcus armenti]UBH07674.1 exodeoxyribonuclease VII small subunit [Macrococcus armenti]UBH09907.1 exodeoxyribonuclease VII small subunit [Macrococcus armenti]UBH14457.1 exodeoxyribonuclease VII small subunit [Macrococcus armenti]UBH16816.1 exodeoxyribonuclease VII small subunit [Macrococcus armenti]UBH19080.1 exodeoxyribonuclease VII small subunit [Macrococcus armenti]
MAKTFEEMMQQLEQIVKSLDDDQVSLEKSIELYEQGVKLSQACQLKLSEAEEKIAKLNAVGETDNES